jgi:hypothetical protein
MKTPTAEEFLKDKYPLSYDEMSSNRSEDMIEFAKLHVKAALEAALEDSPHGSSTDIPTYEDMKRAILESYPLKNIK